MAKEKMTVTVDKSLLECVDRFSKEYDVSKSRVVTWAIRYFCAQMETGELDIGKMFTYFKDTSELS